jgi:hypothetical protein
VGAGPRLEADLSGHTEGTSLLQLDPEQHKETRVVKLSDLPKRRAPDPAAQPGGPRTQAAAQATAEAGLDDFWGQVSLAFRRLRPLEKGALYAIGAVFVTAFLPWFHVQGKGFVSGIEGAGAYTAVAAFLALVVFWVRVSLRLVLLVLAQVACVVAAGLVAGWSLRTTTDADPSFGIYLTLATGAVAAVMSLVAAVKS